MDVQQAAQVVGNIARAVRIELERVGEQHSCILASAALAEVLRRKGYTGASTLTVRAQIYNSAFYSWVTARGFPDDPASQTQCIEQGGRMIGLGIGTKEDAPPGRWAGHAAVIVPNAFGDRHALIDVTVTQVNKPEWGIHLPTILARVPDAFVTGQSEFKIAANGSLVVYKAFPDDRSFTGSRLWTEAHRWTVIADQATKAIPVPAGR